jgi:hypothetical protein
MTLDGDIVRFDAAEEATFQHEIDHPMLEHLRRMVECMQRLGEMLGLSTNE